MPVSHQRDIFFDIVKAIAIFLVVLGHTVTKSSLSTIYLDNFIVGMNMPIFFIISGWFAYDTIVSRDARRFIRHLRSYLQPVLSTAIVFAILSAMLGLIPWRPINVGIFFVKRVIFSVWFLWVLSAVYIMCFTLALIVRKCYWQWFGLLFLYCVLLFVPDVLNGCLHIRLIRHMMPYFIIGMVFRHYDIRLWITKWGIVMLLLFLGVTIYEGNVKENDMGFYWVDSSYGAIFGSLYDFVTFVARYVVGFVGSIGVMWLVYKLMGVLSKGIALMKIGQVTICIYLLHPWVLDRLASTCPLLFSSWVGIIFVSVSLTTGCGLIGWLTVEKSKILRYYFWGR